MAFPQIRADGYRYGGENTNVTAHPISLPTTELEVGDLILVLFAVDGSETLVIDTSISGVNWTAEAIQATTSITAGIFWKISEGEGFDYLTINTTSEMASYITYGIYDYYESDPITVSSSATGSSTNMDPPALSPTYSGRDTLWIVFGALDGTAYATSAPTDFTNLIVATGASTDGVTCSSASREYNTSSSYNPGTFTNSTEDWITFTISINANPPTGVGISNFAFYS